MKAARPWPLASLLLLLLFAVLSMLLEVKSDSGAPTAAECKEERRIGLDACKLVIVFGRPPSPECCQRIRVTHVECVCPLITPKVAARVDVNRAIRVIEGCGRSVPRHAKCGSITTP